MSVFFFIFINREAESKWFFRHTQQCAADVNYHKRASMVSIWIRWEEFELICSADFTKGVTKRGLGGIHYRKLTSCRWDLFQVQIPLKLFLCTSKGTRNEKYSMIHVPSCVFSLKIVSASYFSLPSQGHVLIIFSFVFYYTAISKIAFF